VGLEFRGNRAYYYEKVRVGGKVVSRYAGGGELAALCSGFARLMAARRERERAVARVEAERVAEADRRFDAYFRGVQALADAFMVGAGYHRPGRHRWRKKRMSKTTLPAKRGKTPPAKKTSTLGDEIASMTEGGAAEYAAVEAMAYEWADGHRECDYAVRRAMRASYDRTYKEVAGENPTPLEKILAERVALCHLRVAHMEYITSAVLAIKPDHRDAENLDRRLSRAHRRLLSAVRCLADVRRVGPRSAIQVNIGGDLSVGANPLPVVDSVVDSPPRRIGSATGRGTGKLTRPGDPPRIRSEHRIQNRPGSLRTAIEQ
jgi:hypothetical protein